MNFKTGTRLFRALYNQKGVWRSNKQKLQYNYGCRIWSHYHNFLYDKWNRANNEKNTPKNTLLNEILSIYAFVLSAIPFRPSVSDPKSRTPKLFRIQNAQHLYCKRQREHISYSYSNCIWRTWLSDIDRNKCSFKWMEILSIKLYFISTTEQMRYV